MSSRCVARLAAASATAAHSLLRLPRSLPDPTRSLVGLAFGGVGAQKVIAAIAHAAKLGPSATLGVPVRSTTNVATSKWWSTDQSSSLVTLQPNEVATILK